MSDFTGGCYCRAVTFRAEDVQPRSVAVCHCRQCRQFAGYTWATTSVPKAALEVSGQDKVRWFQSSDTAKRGFCTDCGSTLFWDEADNANMSISVGAVDDEAALTLGKHIYVEDKPPYYEINQDELS